MRRELTRRAREAVLEHLIASETADRFADRALLRRSSVAPLGRRVTHQLEHGTECEFDTARHAGRIGESNPERLNELRDELIAQG